MSEVVIDVLCVKDIERIIKRPLTPLEIEEIRYCDWFIVDKSDRTMASFKVDKFRFPYDVMTEVLHLTQIDQSFTNSFFDEVQSWRAFNEVDANDN